MTVSLCDYFGIFATMERGIVHNNYTAYQKKRNQAEFKPLQKPDAVSIPAICTLSKDTIATKPCDNIATLEPTSLTLFLYLFTPWSPSFFTMQMLVYPTLIYVNNRGFR